jgi:hypothetical protein
MNCSYIVLTEQQVDFLHLYAMLLQAKDQGDGALFNDDSVFDERNSGADKWRARRRHHHPA